MSRKLRTGMVLTILTGLLAAWPAGAQTTKLTGAALDSFLAKPISEQTESFFNTVVSDKELGYTFKDGVSTFRLFVPRGKAVEVLVFDKYDDPADKAVVKLAMTRDDNMVFEATYKGALWGKYYGYRITERLAKPKAFEPKVPLDTIFSDPYSRAIAKSNVYPQTSRTLIIDTSGYNWEGDKFISRKLENTVIYESHIRDLTADPSAEVPDAPGLLNKGSFKGYLTAKTGGLNYLKKLGINAVEFLPLQAIGTIEPPYEQATPFGGKNTWNSYAKNYWGYMTHNFFAPEGTYASDGTYEAGKWTGTDGRVVNELKDLVKATHKAGIAVIMDVVYNHVSQYDVNALKLIDYDYYFKKQERTGCGNEVQARRAMARRLITDSLKYWMQEYHIDGFRFDLATSFDPETAKAAIAAIKSVNPNGYCIAEPWGGEGAVSAYQLLAFGWSKWSAEIRDKIKSQNRPSGENSMWVLGTNGVAPDIQGYWSGGVQESQNFQQVAYIESHDDATFADALKVLSGSYVHMKDGKPNRITDLDAYLKLDGNLLLASKLGAASLMMCNSPIMMHVGQEWGRGKVVPDLKGKAPEAFIGSLGVSSDAVVTGIPTPNSYSADNETNWINFTKIKLNQNLWDYYTGLIKLRNKETIIGTADPVSVQLFENENPNAGGVSWDGKLYGFVNTDRENAVEFELPEGKYSVLVDNDKAGTTELRVMKGGVFSMPAGVLIVKKK